MKSTWLLPLLAACALTSKSKPIDIRYFTPTPAHVETAQAGGPPRARARIEHVTAASHLRSRIATRRSPVELELADTLRWAERPDEYVRRALEQSFAREGVSEAVTGEALTLNVEVTAFEHVVRGGHHFGRVQLRYEIDNDRDVLASDTVTVEREASSADITSVVTAIGDALQSASREVTDRVVTRVASTQ